MWVGRKAGNGTYNGYGGAKMNDLFKQFFPEEVREINLCNKSRKSTILVEIEKKIEGAKSVRKEKANDPGFSEQTQLDDLLWLAEVWAQVPRDHHLYY